MSEVWKCDFPECTKESEDHKDWDRTEIIPKSAWLRTAIPVIGNLCSLIFAFITDRGCREVAHLCPEHGDAIFKERP